MKRYLFTAAVLCIGLLAAITALLAHDAVRPPEMQSGHFIVAVNAIEQQLQNGDTQQAAQTAAELKTALVEYTEYSSTGFLWAVFGACAMMILIVLTYVWFSILRPFQKLSNFAEEIASGNFNLPLQYERTNYFGRFTWAFDCMRREISTARACEKEAIENNKTVIASLSHDIKAPVSTIRAYAEGLEAGFAMDAEKRAKYLNVIMRKCDEVATLTNDMLLHSISDLDRLKMNPESFELCSFIRETVSELPARDVIRLHLPDSEIPIHADKNRLTQVFENITSNAAKYAKTDVDISVAVTAAGTELVFRDYGTGVPEEEIPFLFDKFYRGSCIRNENGAGLGLYIVKYIVTQSGGAVFAENLPDGFQIRVVLS